MGAPALQADYAQALLKLHVDSSLTFAMMRMVMAASVAGVVNGHWCSPTDFSIMKDTSDPAMWNGTFMQKKLECVRASYNASFNYKMFVSCLEDSASLGSSCSKCFADDAEYGVSNCKDVCTTAWRGADVEEECRTCTEENERKLVESVTEGAVPNASAALHPCQYGRRRKYTLPPPTPPPTSPPTFTPTNVPTFEPPPNMDSIHGGDYLMSDATLVEISSSTLTAIVFWLV